MPVVNDEPEGIRFFKWHQMELLERGSQAITNCLFCDKPGKFYISIETGEWKCHRCGESGNPMTFSRRLYEKSREGKCDLDNLATNRGLLDPGTLWEWGCCQSVITGEWLVPGYSIEGEVSQLYAYRLIDGKMRLLASPGLGQKIFATPGALTSKASTLYICEGPWDGMALWEVLGLARLAGKSMGSGGDSIGLTLTGKVEESLRASAAVIAVPSAAVFFDTWAHVTAGREIALLYDSDHPISAGFNGMKRAAGILGLAKVKPSRLLYLHWGDKGYDESRPSGYDVRDVLTATDNPAERVAALQGLLNRVQPVPAQWLEEAKERQCRELKPLPCTDYRVLVNSWKKTMKWTDGLDRALACMLATITSTKVVGDQLWMRIISPPSSGKSVLCEALSVARKHVRALSTLRGFHSGYKTDADGSEDVSLIEQLRDKTLIVKDGDTLLRSPNRDQILSEARDLYDRVSRAHYRNNLARAYEGVNITFLLCGTPLLSQLDSSELGERFLDCRIVHTMDPELEDDIGWRVALGSDANMSYESNGRADEQHAPERTEAMRLTGGFVEYLRTNATSRLRQTTTPDWALRACQQYGTFVSHMRSRPVVDRSRTDTSGEPQRELSFRLISQLVRLARCLAVVLGKSTVDTEVMARVRAVVLDTAHGNTLDVTRHLRARGDRGLEVRGIAALMMYTEQRTKDFVRFLWKVGIIEPVMKGPITVHSRWRLTTRVSRLWDEVMGGRHGSQTLDKERTH
jgi:hypothetical protein